MEEQSLIYDWNEIDSVFDWAEAPQIQLDDETLRDGLQNPSVVDPSIEDKIRLLHLMDQLGIHTADIGLPGAGPRAVEAVTALAKEIVDRSDAAQARPIGIIHDAEAETFRVRPRAVRSGHGCRPGNAITVSR